MDVRLENGEQISLPKAPAGNCTFLFKVNIHDMALATGESALIENETSIFQAVETTYIVLFITQTNAAHFDDGMYSGSLH